MTDPEEERRRKEDREGYAWTVGIWLASCAVATILGLLLKQ